jgi:hypothetical protein
VFGSVVEVEDLDREWEVSPPEPAQPFSAVAEEQRGLRRDGKPAVKLAPDQVRKLGFPP